MIKNIVLLAAIIFVSIIKLNGQSWQNMTSGTSDNFYGITFSDNSTGWAVSYNQGRIYKSSNNGDSWALHHSIPNSFLRDVYFIDSLTGFVSGLDLLFSNGLLYKTVDGGNNWSRISLPNNNTMLTDIRFIDQLEGYMFGYHGAILHTTDGGNIWNLEPSPSLSNSHIWDAEILNSDTILLGSDQFYRRTSDTSSWNIVSQNLVYDIDFINLDTGFAIATRTNSNDILKTVDGGATWSVISSHQLGGSYAIPSIHAFNSQTIFIAGENRQIYLSTDGGVSWNSDLQLDTNFHIHDLVERFNSIWAVGDSGQILKRQLTVNLPELEKRQVIGVFPNPTKGLLTIANTFNYNRYYISNTMGKVLIKGSNNSIDLSYLENGVYFITFIGQNLEQLSTQKIIKQ